MGWLGLNRDEYFQCYKTVGHILPCAYFVIVWLWHNRINISS